MIGIRIGYILYQNNGLFCTDPSRFGHGYSVSHLKSIDLGFDPGTCRDQSQLLRVLTASPLQVLPKNQSLQGGAPPVMLVYKPIQLYMYLL